MQTKNKTNKSRKNRLFLKSAFWTFTAIMLMMIGFLGAGYFFGAL